MEMIGTFLDAFESELGEFETLRSINSHEYDFGRYFLFRLSNDDLDSIIRSITLILD